jgi:2-dehydropantoate 2-reductase
MRVAVLGTGGIGGYFGGRLAEAGQDVTFVARGAHLAAMRERGLRVDSIEGNFALPVRATEDTEEIGPVDLVLVCVKSWQVVEVADRIAPLCGKDTAIVPMQNGVDAADQLAARFGPERVLGGVARIVSFLVGPGHINHTGMPPHLLVGELDGSDTDRLARIAEAFAVRGVRCETTDDIRAEMWIKFVFVAGWGAVAALAGAPCGVLRELPATRQLLVDAMIEIAAVAVARGIELPSDVVARSMALLDSLPPHATNSLQRDLAAGAPSELDGWSGAVVRLGAEAGAATPIHRVAYESMLPRELRARGELQF